jgi:hypothetical protein
VEVVLSGDAWMGRRSGLLRCLGVPAGNVSARKYFQRIGTGLVSGRGPRRRRGEGAAGRSALPWRRGARAAGPTRGGARRSGRTLGAEGWWTGR